MSPRRAIIFVLWLSAVSLAASAAPPDAAPVRTYLFAPNGAYLVLDRDFAITSRGEIGTMPGTEALLAPFCDPPGGRCWWAPDRVALDGASGRGFAVLPENQSNGDASPGRQLLAFRIPQMEASGRVDLGPCETPELLRRPARDEVLALCTRPRTANAAEFTTELLILDAASLAEKQRLREVTDQQKYMLAEIEVALAFGPSAVFDNSGETILTGLERIRLGAAAPTKDRLDPVALLDDAGRAALEPFFRIQPVNGTRYLPREMVEQSQARVLMQSLSADGTAMALWTIDNAARAASGVLVLPPGIAHLLPGGQRILVEATKPVPGIAPNAEKAEKLGRWRLYDATSGARLFEQPVPETAGDGGRSELLCVSPDGKRALFRARGRVYGIALGAGDQPRLIAGEIDPPILCAFAS
jgi:hypothetical protein